MNPFDVLGLPSNANELEIKRAYARLLRYNRPDDDAVAFQNLHEAYCDCLALARTNDTTDLQAVASKAIDLAAAPVVCQQPLLVREGVSRQSAHEDETELPFARESFLEELVLRAQANGAGGSNLTAWLQNSPALYSLRLKQSLRPSVAEMLARCMPPPRPDALQAAFSFFGLDEISGQGQLSHLVIDATERSESADQIERFMQHHASPGVAPVDRAMLRELTGPVSSWRRFFLLLVPLLPGRVRDLALQIQSLDTRGWRALIDEGSVAFWLQATDRLMLARPRCVLVGVRLLVYGGTLLLLEAAFTRPPSETRLILVLLLWSTAVWLVYALFFVIRNWAERRFGLSTLVAAAGTIFLASLLALPFSRNLAAGILAFLAFVWMGKRGDGGFYLAFFVACIAAALCWSILKPFGLPVEWLAIFAIAFAFVNLWLHDLFYASSRKIRISEANDTVGWLVWWLLGLAAAHGTLLTWRHIFASPAIGP